MAAADAATGHAKKLMKLGLSLFRRGFRSSKCKTAAKMAVARIKLLRNKREVVVRQMRRDIAILLQSGQDSIARIRVEHVMREQNILTANEFIELFCELVVARLTIISKQRECPTDLKEGISSLIFAAPRCSEIPELVALRDIFEKKYGREFVSAATDLRPNCGVNRVLIEKLSVRTPKGEAKLKILKEIAKEYQIEWDNTETEKELLKPPEELIEGPRVFVSTSSMPMKPGTAQCIESNKSHEMAGDVVTPHVNFHDSVSAAEAAAESAKKAVAAAEIAAYLAKKEMNSSTQPSVTHVNGGLGLDKISSQKHELGMPDGKSNDKTISVDRHCEMFNRRQSYPSTSAYSDIKFDESDYDEETDEKDHTVGPPLHPPPVVPSSDGREDAGLWAEPNMPDFIELATRFEALKNQKS